MVGEVPQFVIDVGVFAGAGGTVLAFLVAFSRFPPIARAWTAYRSAIVHSEHEATRRIIRAEIAPLAEAVTSCNDRLTTLDQNLREHMKDEADLARAMDRRQTEIEEQLADHLAHHPGPGPRA